MDRSPGFGSASCNSFRPLQTRFRFGSEPLALNLAAYRNSPVRSTKSTRSHINRAPSACKHRVSGSLSLPSRGPFHLSLTVLCAIGHQVVFSLGGWSLLLPAGFPVSCGTLGLGSLMLGFVYGALTHSGGTFQSSSTTAHFALCRPATPSGMPDGLGSFPFARRYLGNRSFFLFLRVLRCFSSPGSPDRTMCSSCRDGASPRRVSPFGYLRVIACLRLTVAFRSLPRPSSALGARASALCSFSLDFFLRPTTFFIPLPPALAVLCG